MSDHFGSQLRRVYFQLGSDLLWLCLAPRLCTGLLCRELYMYLTQSHPSCLLHISLSMSQHPCIFQLSPYTPLVYFHKPWWSQVRNLRLFFSSNTIRSGGGERNVPQKQQYSPSLIIWSELWEILTWNPITWFEYELVTLPVFAGEKTLGCQLNEELRSKMAWRQD